MVEVVAAPSRQRRVTPRAVLIMVVIVHRAAVGLHQLPERRWGGEPPWRRRVAFEVPPQAANRRPVDLEGARDLLIRGARFDHPLMRPAPCKIVSVPGRRSRAKRGMNLCLPPASVVLADLHSAALRFALGGAGRGRQRWRQGRETS